MTSEKYIGLDVHQATISVAVMDASGKLVMESILETKAATLLQFIAGLRGNLSVTFEEGTWAAWLYDVLKPHVAHLVVCNPRKNALLKAGSKSDRIDARKLAELLRGNHLKPVYHGETRVRMLRELARSYLTIVEDQIRVMNQLKALYRSWAIACAGRDVYYLRHRAQWLEKLRAREMRRENREGRKREGRNATVRAIRVQVLVMAGLLIAVGAKAQETKPVPPTPIDVKKGDLGEKVWNPAWDLIVEKAIPPAMLSPAVSHDVARFCPRFSTMNDPDKRVFWAYFFQALAGAEAGLNPRTRVRHTEPEIAKIDKVTGVSVRSEGLLQLSYGDGKLYGCDFDWEADRKLAAASPARSILQPKNNLECGVKILSNQIIDQHKPLLTRTSYWSTLQPGRKSYRIFAKQMTNPPAACGSHAPTPIKKTATTKTVQDKADGTKSSH